MIEREEGQMGGWGMRVEFFLRLWRNEGKENEVLLYSLLINILVYVYGSFSLASTCCGVDLI